MSQITLQPTALHTPERFSHVRAPSFRKRRQPTRSTWCLWRRKDWFAYGCLILNQPLPYSLVVVMGIIVCAREPLQKPRSRHTDNFPRPCLLLINRASLRARSHTECDPFIVLYLFVQPSFVDPRPLWCAPRFEHRLFSSSFVLFSLLRFGSIFLCHFRRRC